MGNGKLIIFDPFRLDLANECLWRGSEAIKLRPKAFAVLDYLLGRPGQLVTKEDLLKAVWPDTFVGDAVLKVAIREIRDGLGDDPKSPRFIETAHRRGYRFIGRINLSGGMLSEEQAIPGETQVLGSPPVVGRDEALSRMRKWLAKMLGGQRQVVFVTGEAGIGKTALVDAFALSIPSDHSIRICRGQCLEQYGTGEAYLPVLEAIARLCREQPEIVDVLRAHAPMWLLQLPSLVSASDRELLSSKTVGATRERMLREIGEALEVLTARVPLVLILEDLHWSDYSTLDLISYLARQRQFAQFMLVGTYRTVELIVSGHPLKFVKQELLAKRQCEELPLEYLSEQAVGEYLSVRFPVNRFPAGLARLIHERTEGNPLFMVNTAYYLEEAGLIRKSETGWELVVGLKNVEVGVPDSIRQMIEKQVDHLDADQQRTLEAAGIAGAEFSVAAVAAALGEDQTTVEARCDELARQRRFIQEHPSQALPDGEVVNRYGFIHALYRNVLYEKVSASRRIQLHRRIGEHGEALYGARAGEAAAELALHFERGANPRQAVRYLQQAAENAVRRFAYKEAVVLSRHGLELLARLPDTEERARLEFRLQITLGVPLIATEGYAAPDVGRVYLKARELCQRLGDTPEISQVLWGLWTFCLLRGELATAQEIAGEFLTLAERLPYPGLAMRGHWAMQITFMHLGEFTLAMKHFQKALSLYDPEQHLEDAFHYAQNPGVAMRCFAAWALWFLGQPDQALDQMRDALALARRLAEPHGLAHALFFAATLHQFRREARMAQEHADNAIALSAEHELVLYQAMATVMRGWACIQQGMQDEAIGLIRKGLAALQATGAEVLVPHFMTLLAEALHAAGRTEEALRIVEDALGVSHRSGERYYEAELHRLRGEVFLTQSELARATAEECFHQSLEIARRQKARSLELRTSISLARLYKNGVRREEARGLVAEIYDRYTEGLDTPDLREVRALLDELS